jgi:DNA (cytosine-5)-methyltransferase 1
MSTGLVVDLFAGGGGTSLGLEWALGRSPDIAINHDREAIAMHMANHPETTHYTEDVRKVDIRKVVAGRPVAFLWLSPDCKHHSKAKGGKPVDRKIRGLAWEGVRWARIARPSVIILENVEEFRDWGPLDKRHLPDPARKGFTFRRYVAEYRKLGYAVETRELRACDYGSPTTRKRLFFVARCDGQPIVWPRPTHSKDGRGGLLPWRSAAECINFSIPCPSIFLSPEEARALRVKRPLAEKTQRRIYRGIDRFVIHNPRPFIVNMAYGEVAPDGVTRRRGHGQHDIDAPIPTITGSGGGGGFGLAAPVLVRTDHHQSHATNAFAAQAPLGTITSAKGHAVVAPTIVPVNHGGDLRVHSVEEPLRTITGAHRGEYALAAPVLVPRYGEREGQSPRAIPIDQPAPTIVPTQNGGSLAVAYMAKHHGGHEATGSQLHLPIDTITARDANALVASSLVKLKGTSKDGQPITDPLHTIQAGGYHYAEVRAFLIKYHDNGGQWGDLFDPAPTVVANDSLGLVTVEGVPHAIVDIGMRMLIARELFRCQGFPDSYQIDVECDRVVRGRIVRSRLPGDAQVRMVGNSVPPQLAHAMAAANVPAAREDVA